MATITEQALAPRIVGLGRLPARQMLALMLMAATLAAVVVGAWLWGRTPDYRVLYANLSDRDGGAVLASLQQMNVPYKFSEGSGAILVPAAQVHEMRLRLASQGLPKGGLAGFELMENQKLGTSQFLEQVNYQRALEGELARSIQTLSAVQGARVHLAIPKPTLFVREAQKPSASVLLNLHPGRLLDSAQVSAIVHLVSNSVADLAVKNVSVVDQNGNLLSSPPSDGGATLDPGQLNYVQQLEQSHVKRIEDILLPITGPGNVRAQVTADVDFSQSENVDETYKPNQNAAESAVRSQQSSEVASGAAPGASGVPGALSNQPPATGGAPVAAAPSPAGAGARKESVVNYEVDKTIRHTKHAVGSVKRLSAAVVVNYRKVTDASGKLSYRPLAEAEMKQINDLVKEAMGFNQARGDSLNVLNSAFTGAEKEVTPEAPFWKQPETWEMTKEIGKHLLIAAVLGYLVFGVLRPAFRNLATQRSNAELLSAEPQGEAAMIGSQAGYENNLQLARQLARQDPKVVASVVKNWVAGNE